MTRKQIFSGVAFAALLTASSIAAAFYQPCTGPSAGDGDAAPRPPEWIVRAALPIDHAGVKIASIQFLGFDVGKIIITEAPASDASWCGSGL